MSKDQVVVTRKKKKKISHYKKSKKKADKNFKNENNVIINTYMCLYGNCGYSCKLSQKK